MKMKPYPALLKAGHYTHCTKGGDYGLLGVALASCDFKGKGSGAQIALYQPRGLPGISAMPEPEYRSLSPVPYPSRTQQAGLGELHSVATLAGASVIQEGDWLQMYQCRKTGKIYVRLSSDFVVSLRMMTKEELSR